MKKFHLLFFFLLTGLLSVQAQPVLYLSGTVNDNGSPVANHPVQIAVLSAGVSVYNNTYQTNPNGFYADSILLNFLNTQGIAIITTPDCNGNTLVDTFAYSPPMMTHHSNFEYCSPCNGQLNVAISAQATATGAIAYNASVTGAAPPFAYFWDFGDGTTASTANPVHTYAQGGVYITCLTVSDTSGCSTTSCITITAQQGACDAQFFPFQSGPLTYSFFSDTLSNWNATYAWDFGDGNTSNSMIPSHTYANPGSYLVCLTVTDTNSACNSTWCDSLLVGNSSPNCMASFISQDSGNTVFFINTSTGTNPIFGVNYFWDFGDGTASNQMNPIHTYAQAGTYNVCLAFWSNNANCSDTICQTVVVNGSGNTCIPTFNYLQTATGTFNFQPDFPSPNLNYFWLFGDGSSSTQMAPSHTYNSNGPYMVCLTITDSLGGCQATWCDSVWIGQPPLPCHADFNYQILQGTTVQFNDQSSSGNPTGGALTYHWDFGDSTFSTLANPVHSYGSQGVYFVCLTITDSSGCTDTYCDLVMFSNNLPCMADFASFPTPNGAMQFVNLSIGSNPNTVLSSFWDFGDGSVSNATNPIHSYAVADSYLVCLMITDNAGCVDTSCQYVYANGFTQPSCDASYIWTNTGNMIVGFASLNPSPNLMYSWNFGDGSGGNGPFATHTYANPGAYSVCLTVTDSLNNCNDVFCDSIFVGPIFNSCHADFTYVDQGNGVFSFLNLSTGPITGTGSTFFWDFGDGSSSTLANPMHSFNGTGPYTVCLTVVDSLAGCSDTYCLAVIPSSPNTGYMVSGGVFADSSLIYNGIVYLIEHDSIAGSLTAVDSVFVGQSFYSFFNVQPGTYLVKAALLPASPSYATTLPTYLGDKLFWHEATSVIVTNTNILNPPIMMIQGTNPGGPGFIGGLISQGANKNGEPLHNISVLLLDENENPIMHTTTNENGEYSFGDLPWGTYHVYVEVFGRTSERWVVTLGQNSDHFALADFEVNDTFVDALGTTAIDDFANGKVLEVFPNPSSGKISVLLEMEVGTEVSLSVMNMMGQQVLSTPAQQVWGKQKLDMDLSELPEGAYLLRIKSGEEIVSRRIIRGY